jgi:hypothetical protein
MKKSSPNQTPQAYTPYALLLLAGTAYVFRNTDHYGLIGIFALALFAASIVTFTLRITRSRFVLVTVALALMAFFAALIVAGNHP